MESENRLSVTAVVPSLNPTRQLVKTVLFWSTTGARRRP